MKKRYIKKKFTRRKLKEEEIYIEKENKNRRLYIKKSIWRINYKKKQLHVE